MSVREKGSVSTGNVNVCDENTSNNLTKANDSAFIARTKLHTDESNSVAEHESKRSCCDVTESEPTFATKRVKLSATEESTTTPLSPVRDDPPSNDSQQHTEQDNDDTDSNMIDLASILGYKSGDRLQVEWEIENDATPDEVEVRWWGATLQSHDGRTRDGVAIRVLEYDPYPEGGFPEASFEDVVFLGEDTLADPDDLDHCLHYKMESDQDNVVSLSDDQIEQVLNNIIVSAQSKMGWANLDPATQATIASRIADRKDQILTLLRDLCARNPEQVVTDSTLQSLFSQLR